MSALTLPRRFKQQPQYAAPIDYEGLGRGAKILFNPALGPVDLVTGRQWTPNATPEIEVANGGRVFAFNGGGDRYGITNTYPELSGHGTFFVSLPKVGPASTFGHIYFRIAGILSLQIDNADRITLSGVNIGVVSGGWFNTANRSLIYALGPTNTRIFIDGRLVLTSGTTMSALLAGNKEVQLGGSSSGTNWDFSGQMQTAGWTSSLWGEAEARAFHENPHQLFKTRARRLWVVSSGGITPQDLVSVVAVATAETTVPSLTPGAVSLNLSVVSATAETVEPLLQTGTWVLSPLAVSAEAITETPSLQAGVVLLAPLVVSADGTTPTPEINATGVVNLIPSAVTAQVSVAVPELLNGVELSAPSVAATSSVSTPSLVAGSVSLNPTAPQSNAIVEMPVLSPGAVGIEASPVVAIAAASVPSLSSGTYLSPASAMAMAQVESASWVIGATSFVVDAPSAAAESNVPTFQLSAMTLVWDSVAAIAGVPTPSLLNEGEGINFDRLYLIAAENRVHAVLGESRNYTI